MILYIHIPFCESKCGYCAFSSMVLKHSHDYVDLQRAYIDALILDISHTLRAYRQYINLSHKLDSVKAHKERDFISIFSTLDARVLKEVDFLKDCPKEVVLDSIYIGGGTPNTLNERAYERIFRAIFDNAKITKNAQITLEANPNLLNKHWCEALRNFGVNRISMGVQSFDEDKLRFLERNHSLKDISNAIEIASKIFTYSSIDLIYGTPLDSSILLKSEVAKATSLPISHISTYCLMQESGAKNALKYAKLESKIQNNLNVSNRHSDFAELDSRDLNFYNTDGLDSAKMGEIMRSELQKHSFTQYEVSSFALKNTSNLNAKSVHNLSYWKGEEYLACGLSAVGRVGRNRYSGNYELKSYISTPLQKQVENLSVQDLAFERVFLGLRSEVGVRLSNSIINRILGDLEVKSSTLANILPKLSLKPHKKHTLEQHIENALENLLNPSRIFILINEGKCTLKGQNLVATDYFLADEIALYITNN